MKTAPSPPAQPSPACEDCGLIVWSHAAVPPPRVSVNPGPVSEQPRRHCLLRRVLTLGTEDTKVNVETLHYTLHRLYCTSPLSPLPYSLHKTPHYHARPGLSKPLYCPLFVTLFPTLANCHANGIKVTCDDYHGAVAETSTLQLLSPLCGRFP